MSENSIETAVTKSIFGGLLAKGLIMILIGVLFTVFTNVSGFAVEILTAILLLLIGIALTTSGATFFGFAKRTWWVIILGIALIILSIIMIFYPLFGMEIAVYLIAAAAFIGGLTDLYMGIFGKNFGISGAEKAFVILSGILGIALGVVFIIVPLMSAFTLVWAAGLFLIAFGVLSIAEAVTVKVSSKSA